MRLFPNRKLSNTNPDASKWTLWRWFDIRINGVLYLSRLVLLRTPWFGLNLHWIHKPDPDRDLHDHPWWFAAFVVSGGYIEITSPEPTTNKKRVRMINFFNKKNTKEAHRITDVQPNTITLILTGPKKKSWGFYVPSEDGKSANYVPWREYIKVNHS